MYSQRNKKHIYINSSLNAVLNTAQGGREGGKGPHSNAHLNAASNTHLNAATFKQALEYSEEGEGGGTGFRCDSTIPG